ncbi:bacteriocin fulvocin C-related protein [Streptomyces sp. NPDC057403]|uniref:bacteriocin fulvocin C-related protein n=1 Tax=Streptomyces sp. NPDC057403 TaxID=3346119 RepID=UPI00368419DE
MVPLLRRLGPRSSVRVLRALGDLRRQDAVHTGARPGTLGRAQFLRLSAGLAVAATVILKGSPPAFAENEAASAHAWVKSHRDALPTAYDDVVAYPESYRRAIHEALPAKARSRLWTEHLRRYDEARPGLSADQRTVLRRARALAGEPATFEGAPPAELREVGEAARAAFGPDEARALLAVLGPSTAVTRSAAALPPPNCGCSIVDGYCGWTDPCVRGGCTTTRTGCGSLWIYPCNGLCYD